MNAKRTTPAAWSATKSVAASAKAKPRGATSDALRPRGTQFASVYVTGASAVTQMSVGM